MACPFQDLTINLNAQITVVVYTTKFGPPQYSPDQCGAVQRGEVQCSADQCSEV